MNSQSTSRRNILTSSTQCCLLVLAFSGLVAPSDSAAAAMITSEYSTNSAQMLSEIEGGHNQLGGLSVWFDVALSGSNTPGVSSASSGSAGSQLGSMFSNGLDSEEQSVFSLLPSLDFCVFASSSSGGSSSGLSSSGSSSGHGGSFLAAILVPQTRFPVPVLNHFWRGADFLFVPPVVPDELLRPPQI